MDKILYITSEKGMMIFSSSSKLYRGVKEVLNFFDNELTSIRKRDACKIIDDIIKKLIKARNETFLNQKNITTYVRKYNSNVLHLNRSRSDIDLMSWIDLHNFINSSKHIEIFEFPSFDTKTANFLLKLRNETINISSVDDNILQKLITYDLILINNGQISLKKEFENINYFF